MLRASAYEKMGQHAKAIADYDEVLKLEPETTAAYQRRGIEHFRIGEFKAVIADFDKVIESNRACAAPLAARYCVLLRGRVRERPASIRVAPDG